MTYSQHHNLIKALEFDYPTAVAALDHHATATPVKTAIHYGENAQDISYGEFAQITDCIAGNLVALSLQPGDRVSVLTRNPLDASYAMYGCWKAGLAYAPVNFQYTGDLLTYQLNDTSPQALIVDQDLLSAIEAIQSRLLNPPRIIVADGSQAPGSFGSLLRPATRPDFRVEPHHTANIIYTSGTTGPSKGVVQSHRWVNSYTWVGRRMLTDEDVVYNDLPMYHVGGAHFNVARALWTGCSVSLWDRFSPQDFWHRITSTGCTTAVLLDVMTPWLLNAPALPSDLYNPLNKVHMQPLPATHHTFATRFGIDFVTSGFGQSESGASLMGLIEQTPEGEGTPSELYAGLDHSTIIEFFLDTGLLVSSGADELPKGIMGKPSPFVDVSVLNELDEPTAPGEVGQLVMRPRLPALLFDEYLAKPEATVKAWRNLWFHTGDAALIDDEGLFVYVDRLGDRIRVRGENISSFHIEEILTKHEAVQLAAVIATASDEGDEDAVVAFVELVPDADVSPDDLHDYCASAMPKFMRPAAIHVVDQIPRTPTNKIEKYKLRQQVSEGTPS